MFHFIPKFASLVARCLRLASLAVRVAKRMMERVSWKADDGFISVTL